MWKAAVMATFLWGICLEGLRKTAKKSQVRIVGVLAKVPLETTCLE
jgi:hypothetical protein